MSGTTTFSQHEVVRALAGAGKTYLLSSRYLALLHAGAAPESILAVTFTRKAAGEIFQRILQRLADAVLDDQARCELGTAVGDEGLDVAACETMLVRLCRSLHVASISTIDSFFHRVVQSLGMLPEVPRGAEITGGDDPRVERLRLLAIGRTITPRRGDDLHISTLQTMLRNVYGGEARRGITGALHTAVTDLYDLYREAPTAETWRQLQVPDGRLASPREKEAVAALRRLDQAIPLTNAGTPRATWQKALAKLTAAASAQRWGKFLNETIVARILSGDPTFAGVPMPDAWLAALQPLVYHACSIELRRLRNRTEATHTLLQQYHASFKTLQHEHRIMLFSDLTGILVDHLAESGATAWHDLYFRLDAMVQHMLVDEFQDTSRQQWEVLRPLAEEITAHGDGTRTFFCVGDLKQAIYAWRGGCADILDGVEETLHLPSGTRRDLNRSWRSSQVVLDTVNAVFGTLHHNSVLAEHTETVAHWQRGWQEHEAVIPREGFATLRTPMPGDSTDADVDHLQQCAHYITQLHLSASSATLGVLTRDNRTAQRLLDHLREAGISVSGEGGHPLTDDPAVNAILAALTLADRPRDMIAAHHVLNTPLGKHLALPACDVRFTAQVAEAVRSDLVARGYTRLLTDWSEVLAPLCDERGGRRLEQLITLAARYERGATLRPIDFVRQVEATAVEDPNPSPVRVMTIHRAKGLEFDIVVLPQLDQRLATDRSAAYVHRDTEAGPVGAIHCRPAAWLCAASPQLTEVAAEQTSRLLRDDLCTLYVAMTRARYALHMLVPPVTRKADGNPRAQGFSDLSYASILRQGLAEPQQAADNGVLYCCGNPQSLVASAEESSPPATRTALPRLDIAPPQTPRRRWPRVSPSTLETPPTVHGRDFLHRADHRGLQRGTLIHRWFEMIEWVDQPPGIPSRDDLVRAACLEDTHIDHDTVQTLVDAFLTSLTAGNVADVLSHNAHAETGRNLKVWREHPFAVLRHGQLLTGKFDRVVLSRDDERIRHVHLYDFKTDRGEDGAESLTTTYRTQILAYCDALEAIIKPAPDQITAQLVFTSLGKTVRVKREG